MMLPPNDIVRLNARATTAIYNEPKIGILNRDDVSAPKWFVYSTIRVPNDLIYRPKNTAGKICILSIPPKSCSDIA
jgi:hypothetical protein